MWDRDASVRVLRAQAGATSRGRCAEYTRRAIEAGGLILARQQRAKDYGTSLMEAGFYCLGQLSEGYIAGDVVVIEAIDAHPNGHMAMYAGEGWISDFTQRNGVYPGRGYRSERPGYAIYRYAIEGGWMNTDSASGIA